jgi:prepilin-type processing-associated H-X9-DG protein
MHGTPINPFTWKWTLVAEAGPTVEAACARIEKSLIPAWNAAETGEALGELSFTRDGTGGTLALTGPISTILYVAWHDGVLLASSVPLEARRWRAGDRPAVSFAGSDHLRRLTNGDDGPPDLLFYGNFVGVMPLITAALDAEVPYVASVLRIENLEGFGLLACPRGPRSDPARGDPTYVIRAGMLVKEITPGFWGLLTPPPRKPTIARAYPPGTSLLHIESTGSLGGMGDHYVALMQVVDTAIVEEFRTEREEWRRDLGFDPFSEFLDNFRDEWAFGGRLSADGVAEPLLVLSVHDEARLQVHLQKLREVFALAESTTPHRDVVIHHAHRNPRPFSYAMVDGLLLISPEPQAVVHALDAVLDHRSLADDPRYPSVLALLDRPVCRFTYVDGAAVTAPADPARDDPRAELARFFSRARATAGVTTEYADGLIALDVLVPGGSRDSWLQAGVGSLARVIAKQRARQLRVLAIVHAKQIATACSMYADRQQGVWPESLDDVVRAGLLGAPGQAEPLLLSPRPHPSGGERAYRYRPVTDPRNVNSTASAPVICEPFIHEGGLAVAFMDGHAEWVTSPRAEEILAMFPPR